MAEKKKKRKKKTSNTNMKSLSKCQINAVNKDLGNCFHVVDDVLFAIFSAPRLILIPTHLTAVVLFFFVSPLGLFVFIFAVLDSVCVIAMLKTAACFILHYIYVCSRRSIRDRVSSDAKTFA